ncbi:MAG TPA: hypothetical protein VFA09_11405 [Ktedonobacteraceae bacterium]|nr:hypothetical protein [Ktedonobacteraceae bacterium]
MQAHTHHLEKLFDCITTKNKLADTFEQLAMGTISPVKALVKYT